ncbi:hypothetical protein L9F63_020963, partial [Diploptera punctata]
ANCFHGGYVGIDNDPRPGKPRIPTDERSVKLVAEALEGHSRVKEVPVTSVFSILTQ